MLILCRTVRSASAGARSDAREVCQAATPLARAYAASASRWPRCVPSQTGGTRPRWRIAPSSSRQPVVHEQALGDLQGLGAGGGARRDRSRPWSLPPWTMTSQPLGRSGCRKTW